MSLELAKRVSGDVTILDVTGRIDMMTGAPQLRGEVQEALDGGATKILLNLPGVATIDSSGIGELVSAYTRTTNRGGKLKLLNVPPKMMDILAITQLLTIFELFEDEKEAVASFA